MEYDLKLTNMEVQAMFGQMIEDWFMKSMPAYNDFIKALLAGDIDTMNTYMNKVALSTFSFLGQSTQALVASDVGKKLSEETEPEKFYHGFVLGLIVDLSDRYVITSNRESGFGRYDVMLEPKTKEMPAIILESKVYNPNKEKDLRLGGKKF